MADANPQEPYHRVKRRSDNSWVCLKCGAELKDERSACEHELSRGGED